MFLKKIGFITAQALISISCISALLSVHALINHLHDPHYLLPSGFSYGSLNAKHHLFREIFTTLANILIFLGIFFGKAQWRTLTTWYLILIIMLGFYLPLFLGGFFAYPNAPSANLLLYTMAASGLLALFLAKPYFKTQT